MFLITIREMWSLESRSRTSRSRSRLLWLCLGLDLVSRSRRLRSRLHHWLRQWCSNRGPRATYGPQGPLDWPAKQMSLERKL